MDFFNIPKSKFAPAKVAAKDHIRFWAGRSGEINIYHVTFEFESRYAVTLPVSRKFYKSVSEDSKGVLVYAYMPIPIQNHRGFPVYIYKRFRKFHINRTLAEIVNPD
jgi:hypothetical protein